MDARVQNCYLHSPFLSAARLNLTDETIIESLHPFVKSRCLLLDRGRPRIHVAFYVTALLRSALEVSGASCCSGSGLVMVGGGRLSQFVYLPVYGADGDQGAACCLQEGQIAFCRGHDLGMPVGR
jgi:hypothetical protein